MSKQKGLKLATLNVYSLLPSIDQLRILLSKQPFIILSINEIFLDSTIPTSLIIIDGYTFEHYKRGSRHGGGVGLYIRDNVNHEIYKQDSVIE